MAEARLVTMGLRVNVQIRKLTKQNDPSDNKLELEASV